MNEPILMKLYSVVVFDLRMCMKGDNPGPKSIKGDNSRDFFNVGQSVLRLHTQLSVYVKFVPFLIKKIFVSSALTARCTHVQLPVSH